MNSLFPDPIFCESFGTSAEATTIIASIKSLQESLLENSLYYSITKHDIERARFIRLRDQWISETLFFSNPELIYNNGAYQNIIGLGQGMLPYIFEDMRYSPNHWFYALRQLTQVNPVKKEHRGDMQLMTEDWLNWAGNNF